MYLILIKGKYQHCFKMHVQNEDKNVSILLVHVCMLGSLLFFVKAFSS
jgi:hypothetical protein